MQNVNNPEFKKNYTFENNTEMNDFTSSINRNPMIKSIQQVSKYGLEVTARSADSLPNVNEMYDTTPVDPKKKIKGIENPLAGKGYPYNEDDEKNFKPHMMYDPKTGKGYKADTYEDHLDMKKKGYIYDKPDTKKVEESPELDESQKREFEKGDVVVGRRGNFKGVEAVVVSIDPSGGRLVVSITSKRKVRVNPSDWNKHPTGKRIRESVELDVELDEDYKEMMKWYEKSDEKKVYDILKKNKFNLPADSFTLVQNTLKKSKNVHNAASMIMLKYPQFQRESVELDEADNTAAVARQLKQAVKKYTTGNLIVRSKGGKTRFIMVAAGHIDNKLRKMMIDLMSPNANIHNKDDISYGNVTDKVISAETRHWVKALGLKEGLDEATRFTVIAMKGNKKIETVKKVSQKELDTVKTLMKSAHGKKIKIEVIKESVELDEAFDMKKMLNIFNKLKKNDTIKIKYDSSMRKGKDFQTFVVTSPKRTVGKKGVERVIMKNVDNPTGVKYTLYNRNGSVSLAIGDMAASMTDIKESVELDEAHHDQRAADKALWNAMKVVGPRAGWKMVKTDPSRFGVDVEITSQKMSKYGDWTLMTWSDGKLMHVWYHHPNGEGSVPEREFKRVAKDMMKESVDEVYKPTSISSSLESRKKVTKVLKRKGIGFHTSKGDIMVNPKNLIAAKSALNKEFGGDFETNSGMKLKATKKAGISDGVELDEGVMDGEWTKALKEGDGVMIRELEMFISNDGDLYRQRISPIIKNMRKKIGKGVYDERKAAKAFSYAVTDGIKKYNKEFGAGSMKLSKSEQDEVAILLLRNYQDEIREGVNIEENASALIRNMLRILD